MFKTFRSYQLAVEFYKRCQEVRAPAFLKNQLLRAASSVALNLAEGTCKPSMKERRRFYFIALGSLRECQAAMDLNGGISSGLRELADHLGACIYRLCNPKL